MLDVTRRRAPLAFAALLATLRGAAANGATIFHRGNDGDPETLDPHRTSTVAEAHLLRDLREGLVINNVKGEVVAGVAESWTTSDDGRLWRFSLRSDAKWSNGEPVTANDFVYSFRRIEDPKTAANYATILYPIKNAEAINPPKADKPRSPRRGGWPGRWRISACVRLTIGRSRSNWSAPRPVCSNF